MQYTCPEVSASLKQPSSAGHQWLESSEEFSALCAGLLGVIHPQLSRAGWEAISKLRSDSSVVKDPEHLPAALQHWTSPFSGMNIISNRETILHRDVNSRNPWYDILATFGNYSQGRLELPGQGYRLEYNPGTLVALAGKVVRHGVPRVNGDRVCIAYYMRNKVHESLGIRSPGWMNREVYS